MRFHVCGHDGNSQTDHEGSFLKARRDPKRNSSCVLTKIADVAPMTESPFGGKEGSLCPKLQWMDINIIWRQEYPSTPAFHPSQLARFGDSGHLLFAAMRMTHAFVFTTLRILRLWRFLRPQNQGSCRAPPREPLGLVGVKISKDPIPVFGEPKETV